MPRKFHLETDLMHLGEEGPGPAVPPMHLTSTFTFEDWDDIDAAFEDRIDTPIYSRQSNPTTAIAEQKLARLAGAERATLFASGMAAIAAAILHFVDEGDHVVAVRNMYGPASNLLSGLLKKKMGLETTFISGEDPAEFEGATRENTRLYYLESPSSAVFSLQDIPNVARLARSRGIRTIVDNTWATPLYQRPLDMGIDLEVHSVSKYLGGHSDLVAGLVLGSDADLRVMSPAQKELLGATVAPLTSWLLLRSLRTFTLRMRRHAESAITVARHLEAHPRVRLVRYPGLESHPQHELARRQMTGFTGLMSFELDTDVLEEVKAFVDALEVFKLGVSWGGHESLVYAPAISYTRELTPERFGELGISIADIRISVGLEHAGDLTDDLDRALERKS